MVNEENPKNIAEYWLAEITRAKEYYDEYYKTAEETIKRYRGSYKRNGVHSAFNVLWSNTNIMSPALFARVPQIAVKRRQNANDPISRGAAEILEAAAETELDDNQFMPLMRASLKDYCLTGRGAAWVRVEPQWGDAMIGEDGQPMVGDDGKPLKMLMGLKTKRDYVFYKDYLNSIARSESEITWKARRSWITKEEIAERFDQDKADRVKLSVPEDLTSSRAKPSVVTENQRAEVWEIWNIRKKEVIYVSPGLPNEVLKQTEDPLGLENFFPTPACLYSTLTTDSLIPIPDGAIIRKQLDELDLVTNRAALLTSVLALRGAYDDSIPQIKQIIKYAGDNQLVPVKGFKAFLSNGGFDKSILWLPIDMVAKTLAEVQARKQALLQEIYEITGMSDIIRGASNPQETATAQQMKGQFATLRLSERQGEVQRFCRDLIGITAEIMCKHYEPQQLAMLANIEGMEPDLQQNAKQSIALLKSNFAQFKIDVETDSTIAIDEQQDKATWNEFMSSFGQFSMAINEIGGTNPYFVPVGAELMKETIRRFRVGRSVEGVMEQFFGQMVTQAQQQIQVQQQKQGQEEPNPDMMKAQAQAQEAQIKAQGEQQRLMLDAQTKQQEMQFRVKEHEDKMAVELEKIRKESEIKLKELEATLIIKAKEIEDNLRIRAAELAQQEVVNTQRQIAAEYKKD